MYVSTTARYLGDAKPSPERLKELSKACAKKWKAYPRSKPKHFPHEWQAFLAANPSCRAGVAIRWGWQPSVNPCGDAQSGLVIDCWNAALQKGITLNGLGAQLSQAQLSQASNAYRNMSRKQQLALRAPTGYYFNGKTMVRNKRPSTLGRLGRMGQDDSIDFLDPGSLDVSTMPIFSSPTNTSFTTGMGPLSNEPAYTPPSSALPAWNDPLPTSGPVNPAWGYQVPAGASASTTYQPTPVSSSTSPFASIAAAFAPLVAAATGGSATQQPAAVRTSTQSASLISGVPNVILYGGAALVLLILLTGRRR